MAAKDPLRFDRTDTQLTKLIAVGVTAVAAIVTIVNPIIDWATGKPLQAYVEGVDQGAVEGAREGVTLQHDGGLMAEFADAGAGLWLASMAPGLLFVCLMGVVVWLLWRLLDDVQEGRPFTLTNVARMRGIAMIIIVGSLLLFFVTGLVNGLMTTNAVGDSSVFFVNESRAADLLLPGVGFLIAALAEGFKHGVQLEDDVEGLV